MKSPRALAAGLLVLLTLITATACGGVKNPEGWASPAVDGPAIYYFPAKDRLTAAALSGASASRTWTFPDKSRPEQKDLKFKAVYDAPASDGDTLYFASWDGRVFAVGRADGALRWTLKNVIKGGVVGGPVLAGDRLIVGTTDGRLYALSKADGRAAPGWPANGLDFPDGIWAPPIVKGQTILVATMGGRLNAFRVSDGSPAWAQPFKADGAIADMALLTEKRLFVPTLNKSVYIVDADTGELAAPVFRAQDWVWSGAAYRDNIAYFGDFAGSVYALDITTGKNTWATPYDAKSKVKSAPVIVDDVLVLATRDPAIHFIGLKDGKFLNAVPLPDAGTIRSGLAVLNGKPLILTTKGKLFQADTQTRSVTQLVVAGEK